jgi:hypothetical protein
VAALHIDLRPGAQRFGLNFLGEMQYHTAVLRRFSRATQDLGWRFAALLSAGRWQTIMFLTL